jgi:dihydropyrimidinase
MTFDTIIRDGPVATASDTFACDVGISGGRIAALGRGLGEYVAGYLESQRAGLLAPLKAESTSARPAG